MPRGGFRCGFVSIVGRPNVGKSTLLNRILGEKIAIISDKPQTTRNRIMGVAHLSGAQIVFLDTPGIHKPKHGLNRRMVRRALDTFQEADLILVMGEATSNPGPGDRFVVEQLDRLSTPVFLVLNKIDTVNRSALIEKLTRYAGLYAFKEVVPVSAATGENVDRLLEVIKDSLPEGPPMFPEETVTDQPLRVMAGEFIREKILARMREEMPYSAAVEVEEFKEDAEKDRVSIQAVIYVERESQKGIMIGKKGDILKAVGTEARLDLERLMGCKVVLKLWVKVKPGWRANEGMLERMGY